MDYLKANKILIFDFDGVLVESLKIKAQAFAKVFIGAGKFACEDAIRLHYKYGGVSRREKLKILASEILKKEASDVELDLWSAIVADYLELELPQAKSVLGVGQMLKRLQNQCQMHIASAAPEPEVIKWCRLNNFEHFFTSINGAPEPKSQIIKRILKDVDVEASKVLFVGDSYSDLNVSIELDLNFLLRRHETNTSEAQSCGRKSFENFLDQIWLNSEREFIEVKLD